MIRRNLNRSRFNFFRSTFCAGLLLIVSGSPVLTSTAVANAPNFPVGQGWTNPAGSSQYKNWSLSGFAQCGTGQADVDTYLAKQNHLGADSQGYGSGQPVGAMADGIIWQVGTWSGLGQFIVIEHIASDGTHFLALYGHVVAKVFPAPNGATPTRVLRGQQIAEIFSWPGNSHLHLGIRPISSGELTRDWTKSIHGSDGVIYNCVPNSFPIDTFGWTDPIPWLQAHSPLVQLATPPKPTVDTSAATLAKLKKDATNKVVTISGSRSAFFYDGKSLKSIPEGDTYLCLTGRDKRAIYTVSSLAVAYTLGNANSSVTPCVDPARVKNKVITVDGSWATYYYGSKGLQWIPDGETYYCLTGKQKLPLYRLANQALLNSLHTKAPQVSPCVDPDRAKGRIVRIKTTGASWTFENNSLHKISTTDVYRCLQAKGWQILNVDTQEHINSLNGNGNPIATCTTPASGSSTLVVKPPIGSGNTLVVIPVAPIALVPPSNNNSPVVKPPVVTPTPATPAINSIIIDPCLNLRASADGSSALLGCIPKGTVISITCTTTGNSVTGPYGATTIWDKTTWNGLTGYVSDAYVYTGRAGAAAGACATPTPVVIPPVAPPIVHTGTINISPCLNLRAGPNGSTALVGCIPKGTVISITCTTIGNSVTGPYGATTIWDKTTWNGLTGYVSDAYVYTGTSSAVAGNCT